VRRGNGLLAIATSKWQLFASTLFTPPGLDIYSRRKDGLSDEFIEGLIEELGSLGGDVARLVKDGGMFRVPQD